jgi:hypothetical protein
MYRTIKIFFVVAISCLILLSSCHQTGNSIETIGSSAIPVAVAPLKKGRMVSYIELSATSAYLFKSTVKAPATGYIEKMLINQGDEIKNNILLFTIKTIEAAAIKSDSLAPLAFNGVIEIKAGTAGLVSSIDHPKGDFVSEGDQVCQIAIPESFVFILDIPFELTGYLKLNTSCEIVLPDGHSEKGTIGSRFPSMAGSSQTERFIVRPSVRAGLPENLIVKIRIIKDSDENAICLPKSSLLSDETMQSFWVMKLINDSTAVKVLVKTGIIEKEYIQIKMPLFGDTDLFLVSGNYGLGDTARVRVINTLSHEQ